ncbi:tetratricopeptide repeat protein [Cerasicoccus frondis]|uniref:tetratricopeptide repeat protein n=1 Tax=Cerasicoccus frondis TaxID=490090 RepID=UPI0028526AD2|nr:tetratricopeptide repeat protein [Cerasicoccus frondis]
MIRKAAFWAILFVGQWLLADQKDVDWIALLRQQSNLSAEQIDQLSRAIDASAEDEDALRKLWMGNDLELANVAFAAHLATQESDIAIKFMDTLNEREAELKLGQVAGLLAHDNVGALYLLEKPDTFDPTLVNTLLTLLTGETYSTADAWKGWLEAYPEGFNWEVFGDPVTLRARSQSIETKAIFDALKSLPVDKVTGVNEIFQNTVGPILQGTEANRQAALNAVSSSELEQAHRLFYYGELAAAEKAYMKILEEDPNNAYAAYLRGCILFQLHDYHEAQLMLYLASALEPTSASAHFLHTLTKRRIAQPEESLQNAVWSQFLLTPTPPTFGLTGNGDPFISRLQGERSLFEPGIYHLPTHELLTKAAATKDPELALGYTLMTPLDGKLARIQALAQRFPSDSAIQQALLAYSQIGVHDAATILPLIDRCRELDPQNRALIVLEMAWRGWDDTLLPEVLWEDAIDYREYENPPLNPDQWQLVPQFQHASYYLDIREKLAQCIQKAWQEMHHPLAGDTNHFLLRTSNYLQMRQLQKQIMLSARIAVARRDKPRVKALIQFLQTWAQSMQKAKTNLTSELHSRLLTHKSLQLANLWHGRDENEGVEEESRRLASENRRYLELAEPQLLIYFVPVPDLNSIFVQQSQDEETFFTDYEAFLMNQRRPTPSR